MSKVGRFNDYLNGLREEFELLSTSSKRARPRRFNTYLDGLKCEFELLTEDVESLQKERDEFEVKVKAQAMEIKNNVVCQRCSEGTASPVVQSRKSLQKPNTSSHVLKLSHQHMTATGGSESSIKPIRTSDTTRHTITFPFQTPDLIVDPDSAPEGAEKEFSIEMAHALSHSGSIWCVKFSRDGKYLAAACHDGGSYIYDVQTGSLICVLRNLLAERDIIRAVCFSLDGKYLATGPGYKGISIWEINTKYVRNTFKANSTSIRSLDFSPNGRFLVSTSADNFVRIWNMRDGAAKDLTDDTHNLKVIYFYYTSAAFSPDGWHVAASHLDGMVRMWNTRTGQLTRRVTADMGTTFGVGFMPDGKGLVSGGGDNSMKYWDCSSWKATSRSQTSDLDGHQGQTRPEREYSGRNFAVRCLAVSPDGRWVASGSLDRFLIWDTRTGTIQHSLEHDNLVYSVYFSPAGDHLASGGYGGTVKIWRYSHFPSGGIQVQGT